ncbi:hypothetical protein A2U01_0063225, partial [Trifolium medium]|nr:hypothetical protein [Trifolium medium]
MSKVNKKSTLVQHTARCANNRRKTEENRATLRVAPAPAARCANASRSNRPNTHELRAAPVKLRIAQMAESQTAPADHNGT